MADRIRVTLVRSRSKADTRQRKVLVGLNLRKINSSQDFEDTPAIRGMINKVSHLVRVDPA
jgi:large subunit ribosomal protein L30